MTTATATTNSTAPAPARLAARWGPAAGVAFSVLLLYALLGPPWPPAGDAAAEAWQAQVADEGNRALLILGALAATAAGVLFVVFLAGLGEHALFGALRGLAVIGYASGVLFVGSFVAAWAAWVTVPAGVQISGEPIPSGELIRFFNDLGQAFVAIPTPLFGGAFVLALALGAGRVRALPGWLVTAGVVVGFAQLAGILFFPLLLVPVWIGLVALWQVGHPARQQSAPAPQGPLRRPVARRSHASGPQPPVVVARNSSTSSAGRSSPPSGDQSAGVDPKQGRGRESRHP